MPENHRVIRVPKLTVKELVASLTEQKNGFSYGEPWTFTDQSCSCVVPILREDKGEPQYQVLSKGAYQIIDQGRIDHLKLFNQGEKPIYVRLGEIFKGDTQERTAISSRVVMSKMEETIGVVCVHASKPINAGAQMKSAGYTPGRDTFYLNSVRAGGVDQSQSWERDRDYIRGVQSRGISSSSFTAGASEASESVFRTQVDAMGVQDDITRIQDSFNAIFKDVLAKVPLFEDQVGVAVIDQAGLYCIDCYDLQQSWKDVKEGFLGKESSVIS